MANITTYLEQKLLEHSVGKTAFTTPTTYVGLFIVAPTAAYTSSTPTGSEVAISNGYARKSSATSGGNFSWGTAPSGSISNSSDITWNATGAWNVTTNASVAAPVTHVGIFDAATSGNLLWFGPLSAAVTMSQNGDSFTISTGNLVLTLS
jgi:hypothetical protein